MSAAGPGGSAPIEFVGLIVGVEQGPDLEHATIHIAHGVSGIANHFRATVVVPVSEAERWHFRQSVRVTVIDHPVPGIHRKEPRR